MCGTGVNDQGVIGERRQFVLPNDAQRDDSGQRNEAEHGENKNENL